MTFAFALALLVAAPPLAFAERVEGTRAAVGSTSRLPRATLAHVGATKGTGTGQKRTETTIYRRERAGLRTWFWR